MENSNQPQDIPTPSTELYRLAKLVGTWSMTGRRIGTDQDNITGITAFKWLHGTGESSFFLEQDMEMDYDGTIIKSHEIIGYDSDTDSFTSYVYSNMAPDPWPYKWDIRGENITISIQHGLMNATFHGKFSEDGNHFSGGWRPNPGADESINAPYDISATRTGSHVADNIQILGIRS